jgi:branched-chain amino acid transport system ATP-binding protein
VLRLEGIEAGYDGVPVLFGLSLAAEERKMTVLIGPNGAGKSTVLKVVTGLLRPTRGRVLFRGEEITEVPAHARPGLGIAACPEGRRLFPLLSTETNLRLGAYTPKARAVAEETLAYVYSLFPRLRERAAVKAGRLSGGEQQMVGIGRALMAKPSILVLDEPSLGLAPIVVTEIFEKIRQLRETGLTVLMVEQNAFQALRIADFGYVVQGGRVVRSGEPSELLNLEQLRKDYFAIA